MTTGCTELADVPDICRVERMNATCVPKAEVSQRLGAVRLKEAWPLVCFCYNVGRGRVMSDTCWAARAGAHGSLLHLTVTSSDQTCCTLEDDTIQKKQKQKCVQRTV